MMNFKYTFLLLLIIILFYISIVYPESFMKPFSIVKDYILYPVRAIPSEFNASDEMKDSIINNLKNELIELEKLNNIKISLADFNNINATIIERNREYWFNSLTVNKGSIDGITVDMAVIDNSGLIGRISSVTRNTSTVKLITTNDINNKISGVIEYNNKKVYGIIQGYENNMLNLVINNYEEIPKDSIVTTTGMGGVFPSGIPIGKVVSVIKKEDSVTNVVRIKPISNIEGVKYVSILQRKEISNN